MNQSERFYNPGNEQQNITPELKLSMELWDTCEKLLQEKGRNEINYFELLLPPNQLIYILDAIEERRMPQIKKRVVILGKENSKQVKILISGTDPSKAKVVNVYIPMLDDSPADRNVLQLERGQRGKIDIMHVLNFQIFGRDPNTTKITVKKLATMEELKAYRRYINQSSPIEHK